MVEAYQTYHMSKISLIWFNYDRIGDFFFFTHMVHSQLYKVKKKKKKKTPLHST